MPAVPRPSDATKDRFRALLPDDPRVQARPMFGQLAGFVNGNMFIGIFGDSIIARLPEADRITLVSKHGARPFEPMPGRPMKEYVVLPQGWLHDPKHDKDLHTWLDRALTSTAGLPTKQPKAAKKVPSVKAPKSAAKTTR